MCPVLPGSKERYHLSVGTLIFPTGLRGWNFKLLKSQKRRKRQTENNFHEIVYIPIIILLFLLWKPPLKAKTHFLSLVWFPLYFIRTTSITNFLKKRKMWQRPPKTFLFCGIVKFQILKITDTVESRKLLYISLIFNNSIRAPTIAMLKGTKIGNYENNLQKIYF